MSLSCLFAPMPLSGQQFLLDPTESSTTSKNIGKHYPKVISDTDLVILRLCKNECASCEWIKIEESRLIHDFKNTFLTSTVLDLNDKLVLIVLIISVIYLYFSGISKTLIWNKLELQDSTTKNIKMELWILKNILRSSSQIMPRLDFSYQDLKITSLSNLFIKVCSVG